MLRRNILALAALSAVLSTSARARPLDRDGAVYTMSNAIGGNQVLVFARMDDGTLEARPPVPTGGAGTGAGLGSQGAVVLNSSGRWLLAANAGSNDVSVFKVDDDTLTHTGRFPSGGTMPVSIAVGGRLVYVLNAGSPNNITGFYLNPNGTLTPIAGSTRALTAAQTGPAQVSFSPDGDMLVVTEKGTNRIDVFPVLHDGNLGPMVVNASAGMTPFGFSFGRKNQLIVSEAFGGAAGASAVSAYTLRPNGTLETETASAPTHQTAACWVVVINNGHVAYTTNTVSASVTGYRISGNGKLTLLDDNGVTGLTPAGPIDAALSPDNSFVYVLTSTGITSFRIHGNGDLIPIDFDAAAGAAGLAAQ